MAFAQRSIPDTPIAEQYKSMNMDTFRNNIDFARRVGFPEVYLWGVEWWYWIRDRGNAIFGMRPSRYFPKIGVRVFSGVRTGGNL